MGDPDSKTVGTAVRAFARSGDAESALERCARGWRSWLASGDMDDGMVAAAAALEAPRAQTVEPWYARVLYADGLFAFRAGDVKRSRVGDVESAEARFRRRDGSGVDNAYLEAWRDLSWAAVACLRKDWTEARRRFEVGTKALEALQAAPDPDDALELEWLSTRLDEDPAF